MASYRSAGFRVSIRAAAGSRKTATLTAGHNVQGYTARQLEESLCELFRLVESRLTDSECDALRAYYPLEELFDYGIHGPVGLGLGRVGGHAIGE